MAHYGSATNVGAKFCQVICMAITEVLAIFELRNLCVKSKPATTLQEAIDYYKVEVIYMLSGVELRALTLTARRGFGL